MTSPSQMLAVSSKRMLPEDVDLVDAIEPASSSKEQGYKGFGSFHSDNVEELIRIPESLYVPPEYPEGVHYCLSVYLSETAISKLSKLSFGCAARDYFLIDFAQWTFINHGRSDKRHFHTLMQRMSAI